MFSFRVEWIGRLVIAALLLFVPFIIPASGEIDLLLQGTSGPNGYFQNRALITQSFTKSDLLDIEYSSAKDSTGYENNFYLIGFTKGFTEKLNGSIDFSNSRTPSGPAGYTVNISSFCDVIGDKYSEIATAVKLGGSYSINTFKNRNYSVSSFSGGLIETFYRSTIKLQYSAYTYPELQTLLNLDPSVYYKYLTLYFGSWSSSIFEANLTGSLSRNLSVNLGYVSYILLDNSKSFSYSGTINFYMLERYKLNLKYEQSQDYLGEKLNYYTVGISLLGI